MCTTVRPTPRPALPPSLCALGLAALCGLAAGPAAAQVKPEAVLARMYPAYHAKAGCRTVEATENDQTYCMSIDRSDRVVVEGVTRLYVLATGKAIDKDTGTPDGGHATPGLVGAFVVEERGTGFQVLAAEARILAGANGLPPTDWTLVQVGPADYWGWLNSQGDCHQGYCSSQSMLLAPYGKGIRNLTGFVQSADNAGACGDKRCEARATSLDSTLAFDTQTTSGPVYPLRVTVSGTANGRRVPAKPWVLLFDVKTWRYVPPKGWPLKDAEF